MSEQGWSQARPRVYKYAIPPDGFPITLPVDARFRFFGAQGGRLFAWFEVQPGAPTVKRALVVYATGEDIDPRDTWLATTQDGPSFVWHLYERSVT